MQEERAAITAAAEKRSALLARIAAGENVDDGNGGEGQQRGNVEEHRTQER